MSRDTCIIKTVSPSMIRALIAHVVGYLVVGHRFATALGTYSHLPSLCWLILLFSAASWIAHKSVSIRFSNYSTINYTVGLESAMQTQHVSNTIITHTVNIQRYQSNKITKAQSAIQSHTIRIHSVRRIHRNTDWVQSTPSVSTDTLLLRKSLPVLSEKGGAYSSQKRQNLNTSLSVTTLLVAVARLACRCVCNQWHLRAIVQSVHAQ